MQTDWFRGAAITLRYDDARGVVMIVANNGRVPTLEFPTAAFVSATATAGKLDLVGAFDGDQRIALKLPPNDAQGIAHALAQWLALPRQPAPVTVEQLAQLTDGVFIVIEGRCFPFANGPVLENRVDLLGVTSRVEHDAPYRVTGFYRRGARDQIQVLSIEHLNPPVTWLAGETVRVLYAPHRELLGFVPHAGHAFREPPGTLELWLAPSTLATVAVDGDALVFEGDLTRTGYGTHVRIAPVSAADARAIFVLLDERLQLPRSPRAISVADIPAITGPAYVTIDGTFRPGHFEGPNFDGGILLQDRDGLASGARYRVTGFLYPAFRPEGPFLGYTGPRLKPLSIQPLG
ncbi:MAG TPA: hypothetical protein VFQ53_38705 [Kofleriaceae bacterium]|nr:hypothetical protein [Kofleriaceae bacterium]